jgi:hypothetical protein
MSMIDHLSIILWGKSANEPARAEALADPSKKARSLNGWRTLQTLKRGCQEGRAGKAVDPSPPSPRLRDRLDYRPYRVWGCLPSARRLLHPAPRLARRSFQPPKRHGAVFYQHLEAYYDRRRAPRLARRLFQPSKRHGAVFYQHLEAFYDRRCAPRLARRSFQPPKRHGAVYQHLEACYDWRRGSPDDRSNRQRDTGLSSTNT